MREFCIRYARPCRSPLSLSLSLSPSLFRAPSAFHLSLALFAAYFDCVTFSAPLATPVCRGEIRARRIRFSRTDFYFLGTFFLLRVRSYFLAISFSLAPHFLHRPFINSGGCYDCFSQRVSSRMYDYAYGSFTPPAYTLLFFLLFFLIQAEGFSRISNKTRIASLLAEICSRYFVREKKRFFDCLLELYLSRYISVLSRYDRELRIRATRAFP